MSAALMDGAMSVGISCRNAAGLVIPGLELTLKP